MIGGAAQMWGVFPAEHVAGFQHIGQASGDVTDFVALRFLVPFENLFVDKGTGGFGHGKRSR